MGWVVFGFGFVVIGLAVAVALGKGGQMQAVAVVDTARGRLPEGTLDAENIGNLVLPRRTSGYATAQVDRYLAQVVAGEVTQADEVSFDVRFRGYDMGIVDRLLDRVQLQLAEPTEPRVPSVGSVDEGAIAGLGG